MKTILEVLKLSTEFLQKKQFTHARRQAEELICDALDFSRLELYMKAECPLTEQELLRCREFLNRRSQGEPLQYIRGYVDLFNCRINVNPSVLIPRQETEILVDKIVKQLAKQDLEGKMLWDVCCGSGYIGIALKKQFPSLTVAVSDISPEALALTKENAKQNGVEIEVYHGDLLAPFKGKKTDYFICNPPYIRESEFPALDREVRDFEPKLALIGGETGLEFYARLAEELPLYLKSGGNAWFEIGTGQGEAVKELFASPRWKRRDYEKDWSGHDRFFFLEME